MAIKETPLLNLLDSDKKIWKFTHNGMYNVRYAYHSIMEEILDVSHLKVEGNWIAIWKLNIPPKIKHFLWRALRGCFQPETSLSRELLLLL